MGFKKVFKSLQEIFPEVDSRLLRAVAIEQQKDANSAVEVVLTEIIPYLIEKSSPSSSSSECRTQEQIPCSSSESRTREQIPSSSSESRAAVQAPEGELGTNGTHCTQDLHLENATCPDEEQYGQFYDAESDHDQLFHAANGGLHQICGDSSIVNSTSIKNYDETVMSVYANMSSPVASAVLIHGNEANIDQKMCGDPKGEDAITSENYQESSVEVESNQKTQITSSALEHDNSGMDQSINNSVQVDSINGENCQENNRADGELLGVENSMGHIVQSSLENSTLSSAECSTHSVVMPDMLNCDGVKETNDSESRAFNIGSANELVEVEDESTLTAGVTQSAQICSMNLLENIIADARNNKKTLFSAMESVISLMREVELQEQAAEQAKREAAEGGLEIFKRVEELKQMLQDVKEANDMHAGEVYGEKAILATEVRELQSRLLSLSEERDKSLGILDEMHQSLGVRLAAAEKERVASEKEKHEKEEIGQKLLAEQEKIMDRVVQEANMLKQEAEENAKLQEFLVDRGRLVDMLQGEISVICQDVRLLKEKFDEHLPLSKSLTSSQTSCILASSSSSLKSMAPDQVSDQTDLSETAEKTDLMSSFVESESFGADTATDDRKALINEGWEFC